MASSARKNHGGGVSKNNRLRRLFDDQAGRCFYCERAMRVNVFDQNAKNRATVDHRTPRARGGDNSRANVVAACNECNNRKSNMTVEEYLGLTVVDDAEIERRRALVAQLDDRFTFAKTTILKGIIIMGTPKDEIDERKATT